MAALLTGSSRKAGRPRPADAQSRGTELAGGRHDPAGRQGRIRVIAVRRVLILRVMAYVCQTASGPVATETWTVDGPSGAFADARGSGEGRVDLATRTSTLSGKLKLAPTSRL
jgi:hypothetical protein